MKIKNEDITVVIQGSTLTEYNGERCILAAVNSIKKVLPKCKIFVSTWKGEQLPENLNVDKVIYNDDPGFETRDGKPDGKPNNVNRQIVSSINGLKQVETKYAMKMRSDFVMKNTNFLKYFDKFNKFDDNYKIFEKRLICVMTGTRKPYAPNFNLPFHVADFLTFGLTSDLVNLYDIPLVTEEEFKWFLIHTEFMPDTFARNKFGGEQSIWINCLTKNGVNVKCEYSTHVNEEIAEQSDNYLVNNFYPVVYKKVGLEPIKPNLLPKKNIKMYADYYTQEEWKALYKQKCDKSVRLSFDWERFLIDSTIKVQNSKLPSVCKNFMKFIFSQNF